MSSALPKRSSGARFSARRKKATSRLRKNRTFIVSYIPARWFGDDLMIGRSGVASLQHSRMGVAIGSSSGGQQFGNADHIVSGHRQGEHPADARHAAVAGFAQHRDRFDPAVGLLDAFAQTLREGIAGMPSGAFVDRRFARLAAFPDMAVDGDVRGNA